MRFSMIRSGSAAIVAAAALTACGGHGVVPSQSVAPGFSNAGAIANAVPDKTSPCAVQGMYYFHGSCVAFSMNLTKNTLVVLGKYKAYQGLKISTQLSPFVSPPKNVQTVPAVMGDATGKGDITGTVGGKSFPLYKPGSNGCVNSQGKVEKCPGKATFVYAELINKSKYTLKPKNTPAFQITDSNGFPGKNLCFPAILTSKGWAPNTTLGGKPSGKTLTIQSAPNPGQLIFPAMGQFIVVGVCE
jgi:hypothetical protein